MIKVSQKVITFTINYNVKVQSGKTPSNEQCRLHQIIEDFHFQDIFPRFHFYFSGECSKAGVGVGGIVLEHTPAVSGGKERTRGSQ